MATKVDIVIVGAGPVGLVLAVCLARWGYSVKIIDNRSEPTPTGRADGIQPRSLEFLKNMGVKGDLFAYKPARVYEVAFWDPQSAGKGIGRTGTWASCPKFIDARYPFTALLHQGLIERTFIKDLEKNGTTVQRPWSITDFEKDGKDSQYPVSIRLEKVESDEVEHVRAKYLFSGEGARSSIRQKLGIQMQHKDPIAHVWGVMDGVVRTDFPDIKMKCTIHSDHGSIMVIPREDNMVRLYIQVASSTDKDWNPRKIATEEQVQATAKKILAPYYIEWDRIEWYSCYPIGQGIAEHYSLDHETIFLGGDACHTHSPKAGQGMNTAFLDAQNLAWKIHHVEAGFASKSILRTYESERKRIAENLLDFDARYAKLFSTRQPAAEEVAGAAKVTADRNDEPENEFVKTFKESCEFTSGYGVAYQPNIFNWSPEGHPASKNKAFLRYPEQTALRTGRVLIPSTVTRVTDANPCHLEQAIPMNGSFRIFIFAGPPTSPSTRASLSSFSHHSLQPNSYFTAFLPKNTATASYHELHNPHTRFLSFATIFSAPHSTLYAIGGKGGVGDVLPEMLARYRDSIFADDLPDWRVKEVEGCGAAHAKMGLGLSAGNERCVVVVRPDGYVGCVVGLSEGEGTVKALNEYFGAFVGRRLGSNGDGGVKALL